MSQISDTLVVAPEISDCPLCQKNEFDVDWQFGSHRYGHCRNCGLEYILPFDRTRAREGETASITKSSYLAMMQRKARERGETAIVVGKRRLEIYKRILGRELNSILEIGAGDGAFAEAYQNLNVNYRGLDIDPVIVESAHALGRNVELGGIEHAAQPDRSYDVVFASQVLEHNLAPVPFLKMAYELLTSDGILHLDVPNHAGLSALIRRIRPTDGEYGFLQPPHHQIAYTRSTLRRLLTQTGFRPILTAAKGNLDPVWGQLTVTQRRFNRFGMLASGWIGLGSLLVAVARRENS